MLPTACEKIISRYIFSKTGPNRAVYCYTSWNKFSSSSSWYKMCSQKWLLWRISMALSCSPSLIWTTLSLVKEPWMAPLLFNFLASNAMFSFIRDKFSLIKILLLLPGWCFTLSRLANLFRLSKAFLQYFLFVNLTMVFLDLVVLSGLPNLWHAP